MSIKPENTKFTSFFKYFTSLISVLSVKQEINAVQSNKLANDCCTDNFYLTALLFLHTAKNSLHPQRYWHQATQTNQATLATDKAVKPTLANSAWARDTSLKLDTTSYPCIWVSIDGQRPRRPWLAYSFHQSSFQAPRASRLSLWEPSMHEVL